MLTLYYRPTCPFCQRVLREAQSLGIEFDLKNISEDSQLIDELIAKGGKKQVPFLEDVDNDTSMYESRDIISYIQKYN